MTSLPILPEKTVVRIYNTDRSAHYSAVVLEDGSILEVKKPNAPFPAPPPTKYSSYAEWIAERRKEPYTAIDIDYGKAYGIMITDLHGFNYPPAAPRQPNNKAWLRWIFQLINEGAPQHLSNPEVRDAYNAIVKVVEEAADEFWVSLSFRGSPYFAASDLIYDPATNTKLAGLNAAFNIRADPVKAARLTYEFLAAYKTLITIAGSDIRTFAVAKQRKIYKEQVLTAMRKDEVYLANRVKVLEWRLNNAKESLAKHRAKLAAEAAKPE